NIDPKLIHLACGEGQIDAVKLLITKQPELLDQPDSNHQTPLLWAASRGHADIVRYLIETGANLNSQSHLNDNTVDKESNGYSPLHWACKNGHVKVADILIDNNAQLDIQTSNDAHQQALHTACQYGQLEI